MTCIVNYPTKKAFREALDKCPTGHTIALEDPSVFAPYSGPMNRYLGGPGSHSFKPFCVTNHPKRSWYAEVYISRDGYYKTR